MCGFSITKSIIPNLLAHRGIESYTMQYGGWFIRFNSLPLSSNKSGLVQPLKYNDCVLVFNGEIFNYKELNNKSKSDLSYLSDLYLKLNDPVKLYKESIKWEGFWAISIIFQNGDVYSFTDPLSKKQLYHSSNGISSEIKPLIYETTYEYYSYNTLSFGTHQTNFSNVYRINSGKLYKYEIKWRMGYTLMNLQFLNFDFINNLYESIDISVKEMLENKIDGVSLLLSSGLDSNIILHHALRYTKEIDLVSFKGDESHIVKDIADRNGLNVTFVNPDENHFQEAVRAYEHSLDYGSLLPNYQLFKACKNHIVLSGDGADELFSGYSRSLKQDCWDFDVTKEIPYYHNIRLDRTSMIHTKENRCPLMSYRLVKLSRSIPYLKRRDKKCLRDLYRDKLPSAVVNGQKKPLRHENDKEYNENKTKEIHKKIWQR